MTRRSRHQILILFRKLWLSRTLGCLGYLDQESSLAEKALIEARRFGHAFTLTHALIEICISEWGRRPPKALLARADEAVSLAAKFTMFEPQGIMFRAWCMTTLKPEDGTGLIAHALTAFRATGSNLWVPLFLTLLADAYGKVGIPGQNLACLDDAVRLFEVTQEHLTEAELYTIRGAALFVA
jgi:hypothetical protein